MKEPLEIILLKSRDTVRDKLIFLKLRECSFRLIENLLGQQFYTTFAAKSGKEKVKESSRQARTITKKLPGLWPGMTNEDWILNQVQDDGKLGLDPLFQGDDERKRSLRQGRDDKKKNRDPETNSG